MQTPQNLHSNPLNEVIETLKGANDTLGKARHAYLRKEAERKHFEASLILEQKGSSQAERTTQAHAKKEYLEFHVELAKLESQFKWHEFRFKILELEFQAQYLELKQNEASIRRGHE